jgi:osmotically-inducible protein OsmY
VHYFYFEPAYLTGATYYNLIRSFFILQRHNLCVYHFIHSPLNLAIMANKNRNRDSSSYASDENWDRNRNRREDDYTPYRENQGSYGNVGYESDYNRGMRGDYGGRAGSGEQYGNMSNYGGAYSSDYGPNYDRENDTTSRRRWENQNQWSGAGNYNAGYNRNRQDWGRSNVNEGRYGSGTTESRNRNEQSMYGGDTSNHGNINQGGYDRDWWDKTKDEVSSWFGGDDNHRREGRQNTNMHRGKGPKGYERSTERIREDVCERLTYDDQVDASEIEVKVNGNEVTLDGTVDNRNARHRAEDIIESIPGVTHVQNNLRVQKPGRGEY